MLAKNGVLRGLEARGVIVIDAGERGGNGGFASEESGRFRSWHFCVVAWIESETEAEERKVKDWNDVCRVLCILVENDNQGCERVLDGIRDVSFHTDFEFSTRQVRRTVY